MIPHQRETAMNGYVAFYGNKQVDVYADTLYAAKLKAIAELKVPKSKQGLLSVTLAEKEGETVTHDGASL